jgi:dTDP-4-dehydrorhamnose reductase
MRATVLGARGQLGAAVVDEFRRAGYDVAAYDRSALDVTRPELVAAELARSRPEILINCVAYNAVDAAEDHPVLALEVNALALRTLARAAAAHRAVLVHYSSDFVFDGSASMPYTEEDRPNPQSVYAASKLLGEWFALDAVRAYVLRVESLFGRAPDGPRAKGSLEGIIESIRAGRTQKVFEDRIVSPTFVPDAARATRVLVERRAPAGLYHCVNSGHASWLDVARETARLMGADGKFEPVRLSAMKLRAQRPVYCALSNQKLAASGFPMPSWQEALASYLRSVELAAQ